MLQCFRLRAETILSFVLMLGITLSFLSAIANAQANDFSKIRVTPPAPGFSDAERLAELKLRRDRVAQKVGDNGFLILFSGEPRVYTNDVDYEFRQENNLYYLTALKQQGATLVVVPGNSQMREILFLPRRDPRAETWTGHMYSAEEAAQLSGIREIWAAEEFEPFITALRDKKAYRPAAGGVLMSNLSGEVATAHAAGFEKLFAAANAKTAKLYLLRPSGEAAREYINEARFIQSHTTGGAAFGDFQLAENTEMIFGQLRLIKSPYELKLLQHAVDITTEGFGRAMGAAGRSGWEYEVEAEIDYTYKRRHADNWGYPSIVGCGANATTLHYEESEGRVVPGQLLLMDVGAEYDHYTADVTRTFPVNGKFTKEQAEIYRIVYAAQEAVAARIKPGANFGELSAAATETIKDGLFKLGLITDKDSQQYRIWYMHGFGHWLGMNVHDVGDYGTPLAAGMVFTNEPGIYIRPDALDNLPDTPAMREFKEKVRPAFERYKNIGVRIEDDMLVTDKGVTWMTGALPRKLEDVESLVTGAARQMHNVALYQPEVKGAHTSNEWLNDFSSNQIVWQPFVAQAAPQGTSYRRTSRSIQTALALSGQQHAQ